MTRYVVGFICLMVCLYANAEASFQVMPEMYTAEQMKNFPELQPIAECDPGHNKIFFFFKDLPEQKLLIVGTKRPACISCQFEDYATFTKDQLNEAKTKEGKILPCTVMSSRGFLPGEKVDYRIKSADGSEEGVVSVIPWPLEVKSKIDQASISVVLLWAMPPVNYELHFNHFPVGEELRFDSFSSGESVSHEIVMGSKMGMGFMPGVLGQPGGEAKLTFTRPSGEQLQLSLPWGISLLPYAKGTKTP